MSRAAAEFARGGVIGGLLLGDAAASRSRGTPGGRQCSPAVMMQEPPVMAPSPCNAAPQRLRELHWPSRPLCCSAARPICCTAANALRWAAAIVLELRRMDYVEAVERPDYVEDHGLRIARVLHDFIADEAIPGTGVDPAAFWTGFSGLVRDLAPRNRALLTKRDEMQAAIDAWHLGRRG